MTKEKDSYFLFLSLCDVTIEGLRGREKERKSFSSSLSLSLERAESDLALSRVLHAHHRRNPISIALEYGSNDYIMDDVLSSVEYEFILVHIHTLRASIRRRERTKKRGQGAR